MQVALQTYQVVLNGGFLTWGYPHSWMLFTFFFVREHPSIKMDDDWGYPHLWKPPNIETVS